MKNYQWWLGKKKRIRKKYRLFLSRYYSPKEYKELERWLQNIRK